jgi:hypothetical protein
VIGHHNTIFIGNLGVSNTNQTPRGTKLHEKQ